MVARPLFVVGEGSDVFEALLAKSLVNYLDKSLSEVVCSSCILRPLLENVSLVALEVVFVVHPDNDSDSGSKFVAVGFAVSVSFVSLVSECLQSLLMLVLVVVSNLSSLGSQLFGAGDLTSQVTQLALFGPVFKD